MEFLKVEELGVIFSGHAVGIEEWDNVVHGVEDDFPPVIGAIVVSWLNLVLEDVVKGVEIVLIASFWRAVRISRRDDEGVLSVFCEFADPAIVGREVDRAVEGGGHSRGSGCFTSDDGVIQPDIRSTFHEAGEIEFITDEDGGVGERSSDFDELIEGLDGAVIVWIRLAGPDDLDWALMICQKSGEALEIGGDEIGALVTRKAAGPDDGEDFGIEDFSSLIGDCAEEVGLEVVLPVSEGFFISLHARGFEIGIDPVFLILRIGDVGDLTDVWVDSPHVAGNITVEFGDGVGNTSEAKSCERMGEFLVLDASELLNFLTVCSAEEAEAFEFIEVVLLISSGFRSVRGEDEFLAKGLFVITL